MVSFIIPAHDEELLIGPTLQAVHTVATASGEAYEVLVVDDASTDRTAEVARGHGARVISVNHRQIAATRNAGAAQAQGDFFIFVDADTLVTEAAVRRALEVMRQGAVGGGSSFRFDGERLLQGRFIEMIALPLYGALGMACGCFLFATRTAFEAVGGFDERLFGAEEAYLSHALRKQGRFVILRERVITSGRKLRTHSLMEVLGIMTRVILRGPKALHRREGLDIWYGKRRDDPQSKL